MPYGDADRDGRGAPARGGDARSQGRSGGGMASGGRTGGGAISAGRSGGGAFRSADAVSRGPAQAAFSGGTMDAAARDAAQRAVARDHVMGAFNATGNGLVNGRMTPNQSPTFSARSRSAPAGKLASAMRNGLPEGGPAVDQGRYSGNVGMAMGPSPTGVPGGGWSGIASAPLRALNARNPATIGMQQRSITAPFGAYSMRELSPKTFGAPSFDAFDQNDMSPGQYQGGEGRFSNRMF